MIKLYLKNAFLISLSDLVWMMGLSVAIAIVMSFISRFIYKHLYAEYGRKGTLALIYCTALGTVIHELSHALFCVIFDHKVTDMSLFNPEPDGTLGYVEHEYDKENLYQDAGNFFIGIAPILMTGVLTYLLTIELMPTIIPPAPRTHNINSIILFVSQIYRNLLVSDNLFDWQFYAYIIAIFTISGHATLSMADMKGAASGIIALVLIVFAANALTLWKPEIHIAVFDFLIKYYAIFYASMLFGLSLYVGLMGLLLIAKLFPVL